MSDHLALSVDNVKKLQHDPTHFTYHPYVLKNPDFVKICEKKFVKLLCSSVMFPLLKSFLPKTLMIPPPLTGGRGGQSVSLINFSLL